MSRGIFVIALLIVLALVGVGLRVARAIRARDLRRHEERRTVDKGKHVEL